jgi:hypothetical protein
MIIPAMRQSGMRMSIFCLVIGNTFRNYSGLAAIPRFRRKNVSENNIHSTYKIHPVFRWFWILILKYNNPVWEEDLYYHAIKYN